MDGEVHLEMRELSPRSGSGPIQDTGYPNPDGLTRTGVLTDLS